MQSAVTLTQRRSMQRNAMRVRAIRELEQELKDVTSCETLEVDVMLRRAKNDLSLGSVRMCG